MSVNYSLKDVRSDINGYKRLAELAKFVSEIRFEEIVIDMQQVDWFAANMCAPFGAILYRASSNLNKVRFFNIHDSILKILSKNGFLSAYGREKIPDTYGTTIPYKRFEAKDERYFAEYIEQGLTGKDIPEMTPRLQKKFRESIHEIFSNAVIHSKTELGIFTCGQYYPKMKTLDFTIADNGVGIRANVAQKINKDIGDAEAIQWAVEPGNTTKTGRIPGGLGLKLLREFIAINKGKIEIISNTGYWMQKGDVVTINVLEIPLPGTVVNIKINTADVTSYSLTAEVSPEDVF